MIPEFKELPFDGGAIDLNKLIKVKISGTHVIYKLNDTPLFLLKIIKESIGKDLQTLETILNDLINKYNTLYHVFGESRCLIEHRLIHSVKENKESITKNAIISIVKYDKCFESKEKFGFVTEAIETSERKIQANPLKYHQMNMSLLGDELPKEPFDSELFLYFYESFRPIFQLLDKEESLKDVMAEFLEKFKIYYYQTGQFMDFTGSDNVLFYKENNIWKYKIGNVIKVETREKIKSMIQEIRVNPASVKEDWTNIFFAPSWIRALNATGEQLKLGRIIEDITLSKEDSENLFKIHQMLPLYYRAILHAQEQDFEKALAFFKNIRQLRKSMILKLERYWERCTGAILKTKKEIGLKRKSEHI